MAIQEAISYFLLARGDSPGRADRSDSRKGIQARGIQAGGILKGMDISTGILS